MNREDACSKAPVPPSTPADDGEGRISDSWETRQRAIRLERLTTEAQARALWGESKQDIREWLAAQSLDVTPAEATRIAEASWRQRARAMRRLGARDLSLGAVLLTGGGALLFGCVRALDAGGTGLPFAGAVGSLVPVVYSVRLLMRGFERMVFGAGAEGEAHDRLL